MRIVDFIIGSEFPFTLQQPRFGVGKVDFENLVEFLARFIVVFALKGDFREHIMALGAHVILGNGYPLFGGLRGAVGRAHRQEKINILDHRLPPGFRHFVLSVIAQCLIACMGNFVL